MYCGMEANHTLSRQFFVLLLSVYKNCSVGYNFYPSIN